MAGPGVALAALQEVDHYHDWFAPQLSQVRLRHHDRQTAVKGAVATSLSPRSSASIFRWGVRVWCRTVSSHPSYRRGGAHNVHLAGSGLSIGIATAARLPVRLPCGPSIAVQARGRRGTEAAGWSLCGLEEEQAFASVTALGRGRPACGESALELAVR